MDADKSAELLAAFRRKYERRVRCLACANPALRVLPTLYTLTPLVEDAPPLTVAVMRCNMCGRCQLFEVVSGE